jgi:hypothetical protein
MLIIVAATMIVLTLSLLLIMKNYKPDPAQLSEPRAAQVNLGVQIICGDCSGEEDRPRKTYLDRFGTCNECGGHSYVLASGRIVYAQQLINGRLAEYESAKGTGRVIPFGVPAGARGPRADKIAV